MSTQAPELSAQDGGPDLRRRSWRRPAALAVLSVCALAAIGIVIGHVAYAHTYQPLGPGQFWSTGGLNAKALGDSAFDRQIAVVGAPGTNARVEVSLVNNGSHNVRIEGLPANSGIDRVMWGPDLDHDQLLGGTPAEARSFPLTLHAHSEIALWVYLTQPNCVHGVSRTISGIPLQWSALGVHHVYSLSLVSAFAPVILCPTRSELR